MKPLNIFYLEPDPDRWIKYDRYIRKIIRRIVRGKPKPGGQMMVALNLMKGLKKLNIPYRFNDFKYAKNNPKELIGVIGKSQLIFEKKFVNPILFGASVFSHPLESPNLFENYPNVKKMLVPGDWALKMFEPYYPGNVLSWPVGIDTDKWNNQIKTNIIYDFLIYDKIRWKSNSKGTILLDSIKKILDQHKLTHTTITYGKYKPAELINKVGKVKAAIFLCEHETQGIAYQQILSTGTPIIAFDAESYWLDPEYYPDKVKFKPTSSVPYWDINCGLKFKDIQEFPKTLNSFLLKLEKKEFNPRKFILDNLTLEKSAANYVHIYTNLLKSIDGKK